MENSQNKRPNKYVVLATYLVAVVCLILGLFLPLFGDKGILALQLPDVINKIAHKNLISVKYEFGLSYPVDFLGTGATVDITAYIALLYAAVTLLSLLALIPIGISTKRGTKTAGIFMYIAEIATVIVTSLFVIVRLQNYPSAGEFGFNIVIALGGSLIALILLCFFRKKSAGVAKLFLFLLSAVATLALFDLSAFISSISSGKLSTALFGDGGADASGISYLNLLFGGEVISYGDMLGMLTSAKEKAVTVLVTIVGLITLLNYFIDVIGLSANAKKAGLVFNMARYTLGVLALICLLITVAVCKYTFGIMLIVLPAVVLIQLLMSVARFVICLKKADKGADIEQLEFEEPAKPYQKPEPVDVQPDEQPAEPARESYDAPEPVYMEPERQPKPDAYGFNEPADEPVQMDIADLQPEPQPEARRAEPVQPVPVRPATPVYANVGGNAQQDPQPRIYTINTIYGGPVDEFMRKLTNEERIEFAMTFIEKSKGNIGNIPDYVIGGNNRLFFSSVFIYLGRIRGLISDGLLNKMYKELNML